MFRAGDETFMRSTGRDPDEVARQVAALQAPRQAVDVVRPATIGDGISVLSPEVCSASLGACAEAARAGRLSCFVPASGAGTRLFSSLASVYRSGRTRLSDIREMAARGDADAADAVRALAEITHLAIWPALASRGCDPESAESILETLLGDEGLRYDEWPKGLIPFHLYDSGVRSAFVEHAHDAAALSRDGRGESRLHITVSPTHEPRFRSEWARHRLAVEQETAARIQIGISEQSPRTDGVAIDPDGQLVRDDQGAVRFRPGGHGALLGNLDGCGGDIVFVRNIDNVARREVAVGQLPARRQMCGLLLMLESAVHRAIRSIRQGLPMPSILPAVDGRPTPHNQSRIDFGVLQINPGLIVSAWWTPPDPAWSDARQRAHLTEQLNRPIRVCGVVPARGHVGGGPFWVRVGDGPPSLQIVEGAELDATRPDVRELVERSTHFNPVDMVCALRDVDGRPFPLRDFASQERVIVAQKSVNGVPSRVYEHPGLWNGGMDRWLTLFVEIPERSFNPVKSLSDLLGPGHRPETH
jgi:hypothetical protein